MQKKITPFLWLNDNAEEALNFYASIFKNARIGNVLRCGDAGPGPKGSFMTGTIEIEGTELMVLNGGSYYQLTPAFSLYIDCNTQEEIDYYWEKLSEGGQIMQCGWLTDKFGVTWQVVPSALLELIDSGDAQKSQRTMEAMMKMVKLDIAALKKAYEEG